MYHYELLCLDQDRTRSVWLTYRDALTPTELNMMIDQVIATVPRATLLEWGKDVDELDRFALTLGQHLDVDPRVLAYLAQRVHGNRPTFSSVLDRIVELLCRTYGFERLVPTAAVVRYGSDVLAA